MRLTFKQGDKDILTTDLSLSGLQSHPVRGFDKLLELCKTSFQFSLFSFSQLEIPGEEPTLAGGEGGELGTSTLFNSLKARLRDVSICLHYIHFCPARSINGSQLGRAERTLVG